MKNGITPYYTTDEITKILKISRMTLYRWRKAKKIKPVKINNTIRYKHSDIEKLMK